MPWDQKRNREANFFDYSQLPFSFAVSTVACVELSLAKYPLPSLIPFYQLYPERIEKATQRRLGQGTLTHAHLPRRKT